MRRRIVIAEDEAIIRMGLRRILEDAGHVVVGEASSGIDVLALAHATSPDLVILDIRMPGLDGIEAARRLQDQAPVSVVFLTAHADRALRRAAAQAGAYAYIVKPVHDEEVLAAVELAMARWEELRAAKERLEVRKRVERAKGILMQRLGLSEAEAYRLLHKRSRNLRRSMQEVAEAVITTGQVQEPSRRRSSDNPGTAVE